MSSSLDGTALVPRWYQAAMLACAVDYTLRGGVCIPRFAHSSIRGQTLQMSRGRGTRSALERATACFTLIFLVHARKMRDGSVNCSRVLRMLPLGDSITSGGGYPVFVLPEDTRRQEAASLMLSLDTDGDGQVTSHEVRDVLGEHEGLGGVVADADGDGEVTEEEVRNVLVPVLFGVPMRGASYRPHLARALRRHGADVQYVGHACRGSETDPWLLMHGCEGWGGENAANDSAFLGFWGWSAVHILQGHPNQIHRGMLAQWLTGEREGHVDSSDDGPGLQFDIVLLHLGTNDVAAGRATADIVSSLHDIVRVLQQQQPNATVLIAKILPNAVADVSALNAAIEAHFGDGSSCGGSWTADCGQVRVVDMGVGFSVVAHTIDGVHPNEEGAQLLASRWAEAVHGLDACIQRAAHAPLAP